MYLTQQIKDTIYQNDAIQQDGLAEMNDTKLITSR